MKRVKISLMLILGMLPQVTLAWDSEIEELIRQKQAKIEQLEKCQGKTKGLKIAGLSMLGITAVGVGVNIGEASKIKQNERTINTLDEKINTARNPEGLGFASGDDDFNLDGQWSTVLANGIKLKGSAFCSKNISTNRVRGESEEPNSTPGDYCWCRVESYTKDSGTDFIDAPSPSWVFDLKIFPEADLPNYNCHSKCVEYCSDNLRQDKYFAYTATNASGVNIESHKEVAKIILVDRLGGYAVRANALSAAGFCNYYDGSSWHYSATQDDCVGLGKEHWNITFPGALKLTGTSICSSVTGEFGDVYKDGEPERIDGMNCWCRADESDITESPVWLFAEKYDSTDSCDDECTEECVSKINSDRAYRLKLFGFI